MKLPRRLVALCTLGALVCMTLMVPVNAAPASRPTVWVLIFYSPDCAQCEAISDVITILRTESNVRTRSFNIELDGDYALFKALEALHASEPFAVPLLIIGEHILIGGEQIRQKLHPILESYRITGAEPPYLGPWSAKAAHSRRK
jgi:glutaredoxin